MKSCQIYRSLLKRSNLAEPEDAFRSLKTFGFPRLKAWFHIPEDVCFNNTVLEISSVAHPYHNSMSCNVREVVHRC
jgi:hypothetical protein